AIARLPRERTAGLLMLVMMAPLGPAVEGQFDRPADRVVMSAIEIEAPPAAVWEHVVSFSDIQAPPGWLFRTGLAYPVRARIDGSGVGAVRWCVFSTGTFREPITVWDAPNVLAFDVSQQAPPLAEWSPYSRVYATHIEGFFRTSRGEFRLVPVGVDRTRLEGRTWYALDMAPALYWTAVADTIVHAIHARVLEHVKTEAERGSEGAVR
ncbi:MAG: SRPBCC family protein, partial [Vicinamibacterales bacterium]